MMTLPAGLHAHAAVLVVPTRRVWDAVGGSATGVLFWWRTGHTVL